ncbi:MAG: hypothetical protein GVY26_00765 [Bacteroidetes bacterium]|nr:hypothetical protein [Bacteroidota bacterium]
MRAGAAGAGEAAGGEETRLRGQASPRREFPAPDGVSGAACGREQRGSNQPPSAEAYS